MRRIVSVWLIDWPVTVWSMTAGRSPPADGTPFALVERGPRGLVLRALNAAARKAGLRRGQAHADARAILPRLVSAPAEPAREASALARLAGWCERWSPAVARDGCTDGMEGLLLDMSGGAHLFGGEAALLADLRGRLARAGIAARVGVADTAGAAWAAARFSGACETIVAPGGAREALAALPVAALRVDADTLALASRFGLKRIGDLLAMPRAGLARRFRDGDAISLVRRLDQALGIEPEPLAFERAPAPHRVVRRYAEPLTDLAGIVLGLDALADGLAERLEADAMGARALTLAAFRTDGEVRRLAVRLGLPSRDTRVWARLFGEVGLDRIDPGFGIDALALTADLAEPLDPRQPALDGQQEGADEAYSSLIDRLSARLGGGAVTTACPRASWLPERAACWLPAQGRAVAALSPFDRPRPILLLDPPEPIEALMFLIPDGAPEQFRWRRVVRRIVRAQGPERLASEWWRAAEKPSRTRDYYRIEDDQGIRYWLFREGLHDWEDRERPPSWWMHGLFA